MAENIRYVGQIGRIDPFDENIEDIETYIERLNQFFTVNDIPDAKKAPALLSLVGPKVFKLLKNLVSPETPDSRTYQQLCDALKAHYTPKSNRTAERFRFQNRKQQDGETIQDFLAALKDCSLKCEFGADLNSRLVDGFVHGISNSVIQKKLLAKSDLNLEKAIKIATAIEQANADAKEITKEVKPVNFIKSGTRNDNHRSRQKPDKRQKPATQPCYRCNGKNHTPDICYFKKSKCNYCLKVGHVERACRNKSKKSDESGTHKKATRKSRVYHMDAVSSSDSEIMHIAVHDLDAKGKKDKITVKPSINGVPIEFEVDTGSAITLIPKSTYDRHFGTNKLSKTKTVLKTFTGELIKPTGTFKVKVKINGNKRSNMLLYVVDCGKTALYGRDWLNDLPLNWSEIKSLQVAKHITSHKQDKQPQDARVTKVMNAHAQVFEPGIGKLKGPTAKFSIKADAKPRFIKARNVPFALRDKVNKELRRLENEGIISPVKFSEYATPIVPVIKRNGDVRICGDFSQTLNRIIEPEQYPLPRIDDIFASFSGGKKFSKIDITQAYLAMEIVPEYRKYVTISTPLGLFEYNRLVFGISDAPAKWQRVMDEILDGIPYTKCILDDIIISGPNDDEHLKNINAVLSRLHEYGLKANSSKCEFFKPFIEFCGHQISADGLHQVESKVKAVTNAPAPKNVKELRAWLGLVTYYHKFLPDIAAKLQPLYELTHKNRKWQWEDKHKRAFQLAKQEIASNRVLTHYNPNMPLYLQTDASNAGLGAVLSHKFEDGTEKPVLFISRSLRTAEKNYSQLYLEATAIFWATKKLIHYLYGRHFYLVTDNMPLTKIFHPEKSIPQMSAMRLQRYAIFLSGLNYTIQYRSSKENKNCDSLSRLPLNDDDNKSIKDTTEIVQINWLDSLPISSYDIKKHTQRDPVLANVYQYVLSGEFIKTDGQFAPYYHRRNELTTQSGCLLWGSRVIIPPKLQKDVLDELHDTHMGIVKTKSLSRSYFYFPGIDKAIEAMCKNCPKCVHHIKNPRESELHSWKYPVRPWDRIHIDHTGPFHGKLFLVVVDAYTKWPEVEIVHSTNSETTITKLQTMFAKFGIPRKICCDNATSFTSEQFKKFCANLGIKLIHGAPYHPQCQGQVEVFNSTLKSALKSMKDDQIPLQYKLDKIMLKYRITPQSTTGEPPCKLMFGRSIRTRLDLIKPSLQDHVKDQQEKSHKNNFPLRSFKEGDPVLARDYRSPSQKWKSATIISRSGPVSYTIKTPENTIWKRHSNQLVQAGNNMRTESESLFPDCDIELEENTETLHDESNATKISQNVDHKPQQINEPQAKLPQTKSPRKSTRMKKPTERYGIPITDVKTWR